MGIIRYLLAIIGITFGCSLAVNGQPLRDINYKYLYNPDESFSFDLKTIRHNEDWTLFYKLEANDTSFHVADFTIKWESRQSLSEKENTPLDSSFVIEQTSRTHSGFSGSINFPASMAPKIVVAKVIQRSIKRAWVFYRILDPNYPVNSYLMVNNKVLMKPFVTLTDNILVTGPDSLVVSYYNDNFPAALPPFAEAQGQVSAGIVPDSTLFTSGGAEIDLPMTGLYLIQKDTTAVEGLAFRVEDDYPRASKISTLAGPLMYICTRDEINRLSRAKNEKKTFDRVVLNITNDTDRARKLIRNYFRRVELANQYFTSYKEGWKTDRGMIYIIFGLPDEVYKFSDREVWNYTRDHKITFNFSESSTIFDPDNYVLIREKKFRETWFETVDLWRNARF